MDIINALPYYRDTREFFFKFHTFGDGESNPGRKTTQQVELWTGGTRKKRT